MKISDLMYRVQHWNSDGGFDHCRLVVWEEYKDRWNPRPQRSTWERDSLSISWQGEQNDRDGRGWYAFTVDGRSSYPELKKALDIYVKAVPNAKDTNGYVRVQPREIIERLKRYGATYVIQDDRRSSNMLPEDVMPYGYGWYYALNRGDGSNSKAHSWAKPHEAAREVEATVRRGLAGQDPNHSRITQEWFDEWVQQGKPIQGGRSIDQPDMRDPVDILIRPRYEAAQLQEAAARELAKLEW